jgi:hypothetical protein
MLDNFESKKFISTKEASLLFPYTQEHIGRLARNKKIRAIESGRKWLVDVASLEALHVASTLEEGVRLARLSYQRKQEKDIADRLQSLDLPLTSAPYQNFTHVFALIVSLFFILTVSQFSFFLQPVTNFQTAQVTAVSNQETSFAVGATEFTSPLSMQRGLFLLPMASSTRNEIPDYFSDDVMVKEFSPGSHTMQLSVGGEVREVPVVAIPVPAGRPDVF